MMKIGENKTKAAKSLRLFFVVLLLVNMLVMVAVPQEVMAVPAEKGPNSIALESLLSDRQFVVQALKTGIRAEKDWGGPGFNNNPHFEYVDHFMYEDLIQQYQEDTMLKALVVLYGEKAEWEKYPIEKLKEAAEVIAGYNAFLYTLKSLDDAATKALKKAYEETGGRYPIQEVLAEIKRDKELNGEKSKWNGYSLVTLENMVEGSDAYEEYKKTLNNSNDDLDKALYNLIINKEEECYDQEKLTALEAVVEAKIGEEKQQGESTVKTAKIYDVILNDVFTSDYTSSAGITMGRDMTSKAEMEQWMDILGNYSDAEGYISTAVDLSQANAKKVMVDDYLDVLKTAGGSKIDNFEAAYNVLDDKDAWLSYDMSPKTSEALAFYRKSAAAGDEDAEKELYDTLKDECDKKYMTSSRVSDFFGKINDGVSLVNDTLANYLFVDTLLRENENVRGVLNRVAGNPSAADDEGLQIAVKQYREMLDLANANNDSEYAKIMIAAIQTANSEMSSALEKEVMNVTKRAARQVLVDFGRDSVSRAKIAAAAGKVANVYQLCDILDDYCAGLQDVAEKIYEIGYLQDLAGYAAKAYDVDVAAYKAETNPARAERYASDALDDLMFLKQIKLRQVEASYDALSGIQNKTLAGIIAKIISQDDGSTLENQYKKQMDALTQMQIYPVSPEPFVIDHGKTLTITEKDYRGTYYYFGALKDEDGNVCNIAEMDKFIAGGVEVIGDLNIECDVRVPQIIGGGGTVTIKNGCTPVIGYVDGTIYAGSNLHIRGSVNGDIHNKDNTDRKTLTVDGDMSCGDMPRANMLINIKGDLDANTGSVSNSDITVGGDAVISNKFFLNDSQMTVGGSCELCADSKKDSNLPIYMNCTNSTLEVMGDFAYYGLGISHHPAATQINYGYRLSKDSQLILHGVSTFDPSDKVTFCVDTSEDTGKGSGIILAGNGTAKLVTTIYKEMDERDNTSEENPVKDDRPSLRFGKDATSGTLRFATDSILGFTNLAGTVTMPADMTIKGDSSVFHAKLKSEEPDNPSKHFTFCGNFSTVKAGGETSQNGYLILRAPINVQKDLTLNGTAEIWTQTVVAGKTVVNGDLYGLISKPSQGVLKSNVIMNDGSRILTYKACSKEFYDQPRSEQYGNYTSMDYTAEDNEFLNNVDYIFKIDGDLLMNAGGMLHVGSLDVTGNVTAKEDALVGADKLRVGGYFDCKGNVNYSYKQGVGELTICKGADLTGLSGRGLTHIAKLIIAGDGSKSREILLNENVFLNDVYASNAKVSFPNGVYFRNMNIDEGSTLTVEGEVPYFNGETQPTGNIIFEDNVKSFQLTGRISPAQNKYYNNNFNNIYAKKDLRIIWPKNNYFIISDPEEEAEPDGMLKVDGKLYLEGNTEESQGFIIDKEIADFSSANVILGKNADVTVQSKEFKVGGLSMLEPDAKLEFRRSDDVNCHVTINGGDCALNDNYIGFWWLTMEGDKEQMLAVPTPNFSILEVNTPELYVNSDKLTIEEFRTNQKEPLLRGDIGEMEIMNIPDDVKAASDRIIFDNVGNLEKAHIPDEDVAWDISDIYKNEKGYMYNGSLWLNGKTAPDTCTVHFSCAAESEDYAETMLYKKGSLIMPNPVYSNLKEKLEYVTEMYTDKECTDKIDITKHQVEDDMWLYYRGESHALIPDDPEVIALNEVKQVDPEEKGKAVTFVFTPEKKGTYLFASGGSFEPEGNVAVDDGLYASGYRNYDDRNFTAEFYGEPGRKYYLQTWLWGDELGTYTVTVTRRPDGFADVPENPETIVLNEEKFVGEEEVSEVKTYAFTPEKDGDYKLDDMDLEYDNVSLCAVTDDSLICLKESGKMVFHADAGVTIYLQSMPRSDSVRSYTLKLTEASAEDMIEEPDPEPEPLPIPVEDVKSIEFSHSHPYALSPEQRNDTGGYNAGITYVMRKGDTLTITKKDGSVAKYTYGEFDLGDNSSTTVLNDGTDQVSIYCDEVHNSVDDPWQVGEDRQWVISYGMDPFDAEEQGLESNLTCLVDVHLANEEEYAVYYEKDYAYMQIASDIIGDYEGALDEYGAEEQKKIKKIAADAEAAISKATTTEEINQIYNDAVAAKNKVYTTWQTNEIKDTLQSAKDSYSDYKDANYLKQHYTEANIKKIQSIISETEKKMDAVMAKRNDYADYDSFYMYYSDAVYELADDCWSKIVEIEEIDGGSYSEPEEDDYEVTEGEVAEVSAGTVEVTSAKSRTVTFTKAKNKQSVTVPATVTIAGKSYKVTAVAAKAFKGKKIKTVTIGKNVKKISKNAFAGSKITKLVIRTKLLKKATVKGALKKSKVKTILVKVGSKKQNKKFVKKYKKYFTKKNAGRKVKIK